MTRLTAPKAKPLTREQLEREFHALASEYGLDITALSDGPVSSHIAIIGEGLGETEVKQGRPFVGASGRLLFDSLRGFDLHRANCYTTNVVKRQISLSRSTNAKHVVHRDELLQWTTLLHWELEQLPNLRIIFVLGGFALEAITGQTGITNYRGSVFTAKIGNRVVTIVASINPAYAQRDLKMEPVFKMDCHKLHLVNVGRFKEYKIEMVINPSYKMALDYLAKLKADRLPIAFDIETINRATACYGFTNDPNFGFCINLRDGQRNRYSASEEVNILLAIQKLCDSHGVQFVTQNGSFDAYWTRLYDRLVFRSWFDTLLAHHTLYPQLPHKLAFLTSQYTTHPYYKDDGKNWKEGGDIDQFWRYNCTDAAITLAVQRRELKELEQQGLDKFFFEHVMRAQPHLVSATVHGIAADAKVKAKLVEEIGEDNAKTLAEFHRLAQEATGEDDSYRPNPMSTPQMKELLFDKLKLKGRGTSTDEMNRNLMLKNPMTGPLAKEMLTVITKYKEEEKFLGTYAKTRLSDDGRFRCEYKQYGVQRAPGRLSSAKLLDGTGGNMQNQPVRARRMYIADPGTVFIYFDLSQAEARVVAWRANIEKWKEQFEQARRDGKYDSHRALAADMFKLKYDDTPKTDWVDANGYTDKDPDNFDPNTAKPTIRYKAKRCRHGLNYEMKEWMLAQQLDLPFHESRRLWAIYHKTTPEIKPWWEREKRLFRETKEQWNALGRRNKIIQRLDEDAFESVVAFYPQSTIGDKVTQVWYMAEEDDQWPDDARVAIDVHDNLVGLATPKVAKTALKVLKRHAESPIFIQSVWGGKPEPLIIPADLKMSVPDEHGVHRWSNLKGVEL